MAAMSLNRSKEGAGKLRHNHRTRSSSSSAGADCPSLTCQASDYSLLSLLNGILIHSLSHDNSFRNEAAADDPLTAEDCGNFFYTTPETGLLSSKKTAARRPNSSLNTFSNGFSVTRIY